MAAAAAPARNGMATISKKDLALALGWARTRLDRRLASDLQFPVISRGDQQGGWAFDLKKVRAYLDDDALAAEEAKLAKPPRSSPIDRAQLRDAVRPPPSAPEPAPVRRSADHKGEATARQRKDAADAAIKENKLKVECRELLVRAEVRQKLTELFVSLGNELDNLPEAIAKAIDNPDMAPEIRSLIDKARDEMVVRATALLDV